MFLPTLNLDVAMWLTLAKEMSAVSLLGEYSKNQTCFVTCPFLLTQQLAMQQMVAAPSQGPQSEDNREHNTCQFIMELEYSSCSLSTVSLSVVEVTCSQLWSKNIK